MLFVRTNNDHFTIISNLIYVHADDITLHCSLSYLSFVIN